MVRVAGLSLHLSASIVTGKYTHLHYKCCATYLPQHVYSTFINILIREVAFFLLSKLCISLQFRIGNGNIEILISIRLLERQSFINCRLIFFAKTTPYLFTDQNLKLHHYIIDYSLIIVVRTYINQTGISTAPGDRNLIQSHLNRYVSAMAI